MEDNLETNDITKNTKNSLMKIQCENIGNKNVWKKNCPKCNKEQSYSCKKSFNKAVEGNWLCRKCGSKKAAINTDRSFQKTEEYREKMSKACSGKKLTNETKEKLSLLAKKQWKEKRDKMMSVMTSDEYRQKHKINSKRMWSNKDKKQEILEKRNTVEAKEKWRKSAISSLNSTEYKEKQSILQKRLLELHPEKIEDNKQKIKNMWDDKSSVYHTEEFREKLSDAIKVNWQNPQIRKKYYDALSKTKWLKVRTDKNQIELLEKWNRLGFNFETNHQIKTENFLAYVDGYDKEKNVILEYDSSYHNKSIQKNKDLIRQQKIINILNPKKFWRYNSTNKTWKNVLEGGTR